MSELVNDKGLVVATLGFTTMEMIKLWTAQAPTLEEVRNAPPGDLAIQQRIMDANYMIAGVALLVGGTVSWMAKSWLPVLLALGSASFISYWHKMVLFSDDTIMNGE